MLINCFQNTGKYKKELNILMRSFAWIQQIDPVIGSQRPVIMLSGTIHACKWFLMEKTAHPLTACHFLQDTHHDLIMICRNIYRRINRCKLMLCRGNFIMLCLSRNAQLPAFFIYFFHIGRYSLADGSQIMVIHLLAFRRHGAK